MNEIDHAIGAVDKLYRAVTGREAPESNGVYAAIPAEKDPVEHVNEQIERLAQALGGMTPTAMPQTFTPSMSVWTGREDTILAIDLPGVRREDLQLGVEGRTLVVTGARTSSAAGESGYRLTSTEHPVGPFVRRVPLGPAQRADDISARMHDGVLEIRIPHEQVPPVARRSISIA